MPSGIITITLFTWPAKAWADIARVRRRASSKLLDMNGLFGIINTSWND
jgi:hypothetical protein